jgi:hypothetical protein
MKTNSQTKKHRQHLSAVRAECESVVDGDNVAREGSLLEQVCMIEARFFVRFAADK